LVKWRHFRQKLKFWSKIEILVKNRNFGQKSKFWSKIEILVKNWKFSKNAFWTLRQTATADVKNLKLFYTDGALIRHGAMAHVVESLYALYNIQFSINPVMGRKHFQVPTIAISKIFKKSVFRPTNPVSQNVSDLDINWPHMSSRILRIPQSVFPPPSSNPPSVPYHNPENIQKWLSSGIGSDAVFYRTNPLIYHKFGNMVIFRSGNLYSLCSHGNQHYHCRFRPFLMKKIKNE